MPQVTEQQTVEQDQVGDTVQTTHSTTLEDAGTRHTLNKGIQVVWTCRIRKLFGKFRKMVRPAVRSGDI